MIVTPAPCVGWVEKSSTAKNVSRTSGPACCVVCSFFLMAHFQCARCVLSRRHTTIVSRSAAPGWCWQPLALLRRAVEQKASASVNHRCESANSCLSGADAGQNSGKRDARPTILSSICSHTHVADGVVPVAVTGRVGQSRILPSAISKTLSPRLAQACHQSKNRVCWA